MSNYYRKRPVVIEARQFTDKGTNASDLLAWITPEGAAYYPNGIQGSEFEPQPLMVIRTLEGDHYAVVGDWIIKGVEGEFYPCKPGVFAKTYEPVSDEVAEFYANLKGEVG